MSGGFGDLLRTRGVARIIAAQLVARFPSGMLSLGLLFHVERRTGSYTAAGVVLGGAQHRPGASSGPATGRLMGRLGIRPWSSGPRRSARRRSPRSRSSIMPDRRRSWASRSSAGLTLPADHRRGPHDLPEARELAACSLPCSRSTRRCRS